MNIVQAISVWLSLRKVKKSLKEADMKKIKEGLKTTEFWLAVVSSAVAIANEHFGLNLPAEAIYSIAAIVISYILGRSIVKAKEGGQ